MPTSQMRAKDNELAEELWYVVQEAVDKGVTVQGFLDEAKDCWLTALRERTQSAQDDWDKKVKNG